MYEAYFGFTERPFAAIPRSDRYFPAAAVEAARQTLIRCIDRFEGCGLIVLKRLSAAQFDGLATVRRFAHDLEVGFGIEDQRESGSNERLVVDDADTQHQVARATSSRGIVAATRNPPPGRGPACSVPWNRSTRSRIPMIPWPTFDRSSSVVVPLPSSVISTRIALGA